MWGPLCEKTATEPKGPRGAAAASAAEGLRPGAAGEGGPTSDHKSGDRLCSCFFSFFFFYSFFFFNL